MSSLWTVQTFTAAAAALSGVSLIMAAALCLSLASIRSKLHLLLDKKGILRTSSIPPGVIHFGTLPPAENRDEILQRKLRHVKQLDEMLKEAEGNIRRNSLEMTFILQRVSELERCKEKQRRKLSPHQCKMKTNHPSSSLSYPAGLPEDTTVSIGTCSLEIMRDQSSSIERGMNVFGPQESPFSTTTTLGDATIERERSFLIGYLTQKKIQRLTLSPGNQSARSGGSLGALSMSEPSDISVCTPQLLSPQNRGKYAFFSAGNSGSSLSYAPSLWPSSENSSGEGETAESGRAENGGGPIRNAYTISLENSRCLTSLVTANRVPQLNMMSTYPEHGSVRGETPSQGQEGSVACTKATAPASTVSSLFCTQGTVSVKGSAIRLDDKHLDAEFGLHRSESYRRTPFELIKVKADIGFVDDLPSQSELCNFNPVLESEQLQQHQQCNKGCAKVTHGIESLEDEKGQHLHPSSGNNAKTVSIISSSTTNIKQLPTAVFRRGSPANPVPSRSASTSPLNFDKCSTNVSANTDTCMGPTTGQPSSSISDWNEASRDTCAHTFSPPRDHDASERKSIGLIMPRGPQRSKSPPKQDDVMLSVQMQSDDENRESPPGGLHANIPSTVIMFVAKEQGAAQEQGRRSDYIVRGPRGYNACTLDDIKLHGDNNEKVRRAMSMRPVEVALGLSSCARLVGSNKRLVCREFCSELGDDTDEAEFEDNLADSEGISVLNAIASTTSSRTRHIHIPNLQISGMGDEVVGRACIHRDAGARVTSPAFPTLEMEGDDTACLVSAVEVVEDHVAVFTRESIDGEYFDENFDYCFDYCEGNSSSPPREQDAGGSDNTGARKHQDALMSSNIPLQVSLELSNSPLIVSPIYDESILMACRDTGALCFREKIPVFERRDALRREGEDLPHLPDPEQRLPLTLSPIYPCANVRSITQAHATEDIGRCAN